MNSQNSISRRDALKTIGAGAALLGLGAMIPSRSVAASNAMDLPQPFTLPKLSYGYDQLEPHIDAQTMQIHHSKHHAAYIANANAALKDYPDLKSLTAVQIIQKLPDMPEKIRMALRNNVGGHLNHSFFWQAIGPAGGGAPVGALAAAIDKTFGSFDAFKTQFADASAKRFGSGWAWLNVKGGTLSISSTANQDSPLTEGAMPVLGIDVWEHAYYLKYQNVRADYVKAFWNVVNWKQAEAMFASASA